MRTKLLLTAAAALAAGLVSSNAQGTVYSANVVGYVTVVAPGNSAYTLLCNPLDNGTNSLLGLVNPPTLSKAYVWTGTTFQGYTKTSTSWSPTPIPTIAPGEGFFLVPHGSSPVTNVFVGSVVAAPGANVTNSLSGNSAYTLVGSMIPYSDTLDGTNLNLTPPTLSKVYVWTGTSFKGYTKTSTSYSPTPLPTITPGEGFFVVPHGSTSYNWVQSLPSN